MRTVAALSALAGATNAIQTIEAYGNKFFYEDGTQYLIKGIAYQLRPGELQFGRVIQSAC